MLLKQKFWGNSVQEQNNNRITILLYFYWALPYNILYIRDVIILKLICYLFSMVISLIGVYSTTQKWKQNVICGSFSSISKLWKSNLINKCCISLSFSFNWRKQCLIWVSSVQQSESIYASHKSLWTCVHCDPATVSVKMNQISLLTSFCELWPYSTSAIDKELHIFHYLLNREPLRSKTLFVPQWAN